MQYSLEFGVGISTRSKKWLATEAKVGPGEFFCEMMQRDRQRRNIVVVGVTHQCIGVKAISMSVSRIGYRFVDG